jgi:acyl-CoA thioester hydrolase
VFTYRAPVRYLEVDQQGVVFNMWYLAYMDEAFGDFLCRDGMTFDDMFAAGVDVQLVHTELDWTGSLKRGNQIAVEVEVVKIGRTSFTVRFGIGDGEQTVVTATTVYVCIATDGSGSIEPPPILRLALDRNTV